MDKQNYTIRKQEAQALNQYFLELSEDLKREVTDKILKRKRVLKDVTLLLKAISLYFVDQLSFQRVSDTMACKYDVILSDTAWRKQILKAAPILLDWAQHRINQTEAPSSGKVLGCSSVYAIDATDLSTQGGNTTAVRVHTLFSVSAHQCIRTEITDHHGAEALSRFPLQKGALYLADRAYGKASQLAYALEQQAHFVIRIAPKQVRFFTGPDCRERLSFQHLLQGSSFSAAAYFQYSKRIYCVRLLGEKLPEEKQAAAVKRVCRKANRNMRSPSQLAVEASKWLILAASLPDIFSNAEIIRAYSLRWQIELHFKRSKSCLNFHRIKRSSSFYKERMVTLWIALSFLAASLPLAFLRSSRFPFSDFNSFSLAALLLP